MDLFLSIPLVLLEPVSERKLMYGKAGAFRLKQINKDVMIVEYRSPSNYWVTSEDLIRFAYQQSLKAVNFVKEQGIITNPNDIIDAINTNSSDKAREVLSDYNIDIPLHLKFNNESEKIDQLKEENNEIDLE